MWSPYLGKVYLIGAGPGDPELITLKALNILKKAEIILYDSLLNKRILDYAPKNCEKIFVGKRLGQHSLSQSEINELLLDHVKKNTRARQGKKVIRLKGGDPFIFGRGGEEINFLNQNNIEVEVIPGVTTAVAASARLKVPLTHRELGQSVIFLSGYSKDSTHEHLPDYDWNFLVNNSLTLVIYMGLKNILLIVEKLIAFGKPPDTGIAAISHCTLPNETVLITTLEKIEHDLKNQPIEFPAIIVVGDVIQMNSAYSTKKPTEKKRKEITKIKDEEKMLLLLFHGAQKLQYSPLPGNLIEALKQEINHASICYAFLTESIKPFWGDVIEEASQKNEVKEIDIFPVFLLPGKHLDEDIPNGVVKFREKYSKLKINLGPPPHIIGDFLPTLAKLSKDILSTN